MNTNDEKEPKKKKSKRKLLYWLCADLLFAIALVVLLLYKPAGYNPVIPTVDSNEPQEVHGYLTHLSSEVYNGIQTKKPFDLEIVEEGINQAISQAKWPMESEGIIFAAPKASFTTEGISLIGTATVEGINLAITIEGQPTLSEQGQLNLHIKAIRIGAMNITLVAKMIAKHMYNEKFAWVFTDSTDVRGHIATSFLEDKPFDPVFDYDDKYIRLTGMTLEKGRTRLTLVPVPRPRP